MKNQRKKIIAIILLLVILVLGGVSVFIATRISTQQAVAPTAPTSKPQASETATWVTSSACSMQITIPAPACTPRPVCLDDKPTACTEPTPGAGGYCPYLTCGKVKKIFKNVTGNTAGVYNTDTVNQLVPTAAGTPVVINPGEMYIYQVPYSVDLGGATSADQIKSAVITDTLDSRLEYVDGVTVCVAAANVVTCTLNEASAKAAGGSVAYRVKVKSTSALTALTNKAVIVARGADAAVLGSAACYNEAIVTNAPVVSVACNKKEALNVTNTGIITTIGKDKTFIYSMDLTNSGDLTATNVIVTDVLPTKLAFVESASGCTFDEATRVVSCKTSLNAKETKKVTFKVKTLSTVTDNEKITNKAICKLETSAANVTGSECTNEIKVALPFLTAVKKAYLNNTNNQAGVYQLTTAINTVSKNQIFVYAIEMENTGTGTASGVTINDPLTGENQDQLTLVDRDPKCNWSDTDKKMTCNVDIQPGAKERIAFRVKVSDGISNGVTIKNVGHVLSEGQDLTVTKDLTVSTVVGCNHVCTTDAECSTGLTCDTTSTKCRKTACSTEDSCVCPIAATETPAPTRAVTPTATVTRPVVNATTTAPTAPITTTSPEVLPETGILDIPGVTVFGGGLLLAVIGLLLAL